jgi:Domain of unknown function (DUF1905)/Bacteriocin-protection, YdeI or OmpD-Associated
MKIVFRSKLIRPEVVGAWTFALVPKPSASQGGFRARMRVKGTIDGVPFRSSLIPRGGGAVFIVVNSELRERIGKNPGATVEIELELDTKPVVVPLHPAFRKALLREPKLKAVFDGLAPSRRLAFVRWISDAKQESTRDRRITTALGMIRRGEKLN